MKKLKLMIRKYLEKKLHTSLRYGGKRVFMEVIVPKQAVIDNQYFNYINKHHLTVRVVVFEVSNEET